MQAAPIQTAGSVLTYVLIGILVAALVVFVGAAWVRSCKTENFTYMASLARSLDRQAVADKTREMSAEAAAMPPPMNSMTRSSNVSPFTNGPADSAAFVEGFAGPVRGVGSPDCIMQSKEAAELYEMLSTRRAATEEGPDDLRELQLILSKLTCFKRDLTGAAGVVAATRTQPFSTAHDLEPVAETTARCFAKTIPQRDLQLTFDKWGSRGTFLLKRLCTEESLRDSEEKRALELFGAVVADVADVAMGRCCKDAGAAVIAGQSQPRMVGGFEPPAIGGLREYNGYY